MRYLFSIILSLTLFQCSIVDTELTTITQTSHDFFQFEYSNSQKTQSADDLTGLDVQIDRELIDVQDRVNLDLAKQILAIAKQSDLSSDIDNVINRYGYVAWNDPINCKECNDFTFYFPTYKQNKRVESLLVATSRANKFHFYFIERDQILDSNFDDNWVRAFLHYEYELGNYHSFSNEIVENPYAKCNEPYASVARRVGDCWLTYAIIECIPTNAQIVCSGGGGGTSTGGGNSTPGGIIGGYTGPSGGGGGAVGGSTGSTNGTPITEIDIVFGRDYREYEPHEMEEFTNCPSGYYHSSGGTKDQILAEYTSPYCGNPDIHLTPGREIVLVCSVRSGRPRTPVYTGAQLSEFNCR